MDKQKDGQEQAYFLTVSRCGGKRGVFCRRDGTPFPSPTEGGPHTKLEMQDILGLFWIILAPKSQPFTYEELSKFTLWRSLAEYSGIYGIALKVPPLAAEVKS